MLPTRGHTLQYPVIGPSVVLTLSNMNVFYHWWESLGRYFKRARGLPLVCLFVKWRLYGVVVGPLTGTGTSLVGLRPRATLPFAALVPPYISPSPAISPSSLHSGVLLIRHG